MRSAAFAAAFFVLGVFATVGYSALWSWVTCPVCTCAKDSDDGKCSCDWKQYTNGYRCDAKCNLCDAK